MTPKGGPVRPGRDGGRPASGRYTAPIPSEYRHSPWYVPAMMFAFFGVGVLGIVLNYLGLLPGGASNVYLLVGLVLIVLGFITATRYR
ncbi:MAG: cell division protein CrgA [Acidimicrobiales bacterium]